MFLIKAIAMQINDLCNLFKVQKKHVGKTETKLRLGKYTVFPFKL